MTFQEVILSEDQERQIISEIVNCFNHAKDDQEAIFRCMNRFSIKFSKMSYNSSRDVSKFAIEALRITTILFQESNIREEALERELNELDPDDKIFYKYQLKKALT